MFGKKDLTDMGNYKDEYNEYFDFEVETYVYDLDILNEKDIDKIIKSFEKWTISPNYTQFKDPFKNTDKEATYIVGKSHLIENNFITNHNSQEIVVSIDDSYQLLEANVFEFHKRNNENYKQDNWYLFITYDLTKPVDEQLKDCLDSLEIQNRVLEKMKPKIRKLIQELI